MLTCEPGTLAPVVHVVVPLRQHNSAPFRPGTANNPPFANSSLHRNCSVIA